MSGGPPGGPEGVGRPTQSFGMGRKAHPEVREVLVSPPGGADGSGGQPRGQGEVVRPTHRSGRGRRPSRRLKMGREAHSQV